MTCHVTDQQSSKYVSKHTQCLQKNARAGTRCHLFKLRRSIDVKIGICQAMAHLDSSNSTSDGSPSPARGIRPTRSKKVPAKYRQELEEEDNTILTFEELELEQSSVIKV